MKRFLLIVAILMLFSGCGAPGKHAVARYDFGAAPQAIKAVLPVKLQLLPVFAPHWINSDSINYRLAYRQGNQLAAYTESAWIAPPAELIALRLHSASPDHFLAAGNFSARAPCTLQFGLATFEQVFDTPGTSHARVTLHIMLSGRKSRESVAQADMHSTVAAATPDARGGSAALAAASDASVQQTLLWLQQVFDAGSAAGRKHIAMCGGEP